MGIIKIEPARHSKRELPGVPDVLEPNESYKVIPIPHKLQGPIWSPLGPGAGLTMPL